MEHYTALVLARCHSVEVEHVPDNEEGGENVAEDEEKDDSEECVDAVLAMNQLESYNNKNYFRPCSTW